MKKKEKTLLYERIKQEVEFDIIKGNYQSTDKFPTITDFSAKYECGKNTAQNVLNMLEEDGILVKSNNSYYLKPLIRERLLKKHKNILGQQIDKMFKMANIVGITEDEIKARVLKYINHEK